MRVARSPFRDNPAGVAICLIAERIWRRMISALMAKSLKAPGLFLGSGCRVHGGRYISIGQGMFAYRNLWLQAIAVYRAQSFAPVITIGDHVSFSDSVHISAIEKIVIGNHVLFGSKVYVSDHNHGIYRGDRQSRPEEPPADRTLGGGGPVTLGDRVWIGDNSLIVGPASVGSGAIIGANSLVRGVVPQNCMVAGSPARVIKVFNSATGCWEKA